MKIIFMCKYNAFRSRTAEAYFNKISKNRKIKAVSRGFIGGERADKTQISEAKKILGVNINGQGKTITLKEMVAADKIIVAASDIPKVMFNYSLEPILEKVEFWKIPDEQKGRKGKVDKTVNLIKKKVDSLVKSLEKNK